MIRVKVDGDFSKTKQFLKRVRRNQLTRLKRFGEMGVDALSAATPKDTGETAASWYYRITENRSGAVIEWCNRHIETDVPIAVIIQYGHGTGNGGYVPGIDYINPAMKPIFEQIEKEIWG